MARSSSGKSVARAAATGGGATYRGQMPVNWYAALVVIVLVGLGSVAFAKYHYNQTAPVGRAHHHDDLARRLGRRHLRDHAGGPAGLTAVDHHRADHDGSGSAPDRAEELE